MPPDTAPVQAAPPEMNELQQRIQRMLDGGEEPPDDMVAFQLEKIRELRSQVAQTDQALGQARQQTTALEQQFLQLQGAHNQQIVALQQWLERKPQAEA